MQRRADNTIDLDPKEREVTDLFLQLIVEESMALPEAALHALSVLPKPDPAFVAWLGQQDHETETT